jgi:VanZ family protein
MKPTALKDKRTLLLLGLTLLWMAVIFYFSAQPAEESTQMSSFAKELLEKMLNFIFQGKVPGFLSDGILVSEHLIRKYGHFTEYLILGILTVLTAKRLLTGKAVLMALLVCILYASSDEFHQIFVSGRGPLVTDVLLDSAAAAAGIFAVGIRAAASTARART